VRVCVCVRANTCHPKADGQSCDGDDIFPCEAAGSRTLELATARSWSTLILQDLAIEKNGESLDLVPREVDASATVRRRGRRAAARGLEDQDRDEGAAGAGDDVGAVDDDERVCVCDVCVCMMCVCDV